MVKLPEGKVYYSITEIADLTKVKPHVLRYWESEFPALSPKKNRAGNRVYQERDIKLIFLIRHLLYEEGYTIAGAKKKLSRKGTMEDEGDEPAIGNRSSEMITTIEQDLQRILKILS